MYLYFDFYFALSFLSSFFINPFSTFFTMSHLTVPGVMQSIRSITGRLVLICLSCREEKQTNKQNIKCANSKVSGQCIRTNEHAVPWSCWSVCLCGCGSRWCWPSPGWSGLRPFLHHLNLTKPGLCTWGRVKIRNVISFGTDYYSRCLPDKTPTTLTDTDYWQESKF